MIIIGFFLWVAALGGDATPTLAKDGKDARDLTRVKDTARFASEEHRSAAATNELTKLHAERDALKAKEVAVLKERESANKNSLSDAHLVIDRLEGQVGAQERELAKARSVILGLEADVGRMGSGFLKSGAPAANVGLLPIRSVVKGLEADLEREGRALLKSESEHHSTVKRVEEKEEKEEKPVAKEPKEKEVSARGALGHEVHGLAAKISALVKSSKGAESKLARSLLSGFRQLEKHVASEEKVAGEDAMNLKAITNQRDALADTVQRISHGDSQEDQTQKTSTDVTEQDSESQDSETQDVDVPEPVAVVERKPTPTPVKHHHKKHASPSRAHEADIAQASANANMRARANWRMHPRAGAKRVVLAAEDPEVADSETDSDDEPVALADKTVDAEKVETEKTETEKTEKVETEKIEEKAEKVDTDDTADAEKTEDTADSDASTEADDSAEEPEDPAPAAKESVNATAASDELLPPPPLPSSDDASLITIHPRKSLRAIRLTAPDDDAESDEDDDIDHIADVVADVAAEEE